MGEWQSALPSEEDLASTAPFCIDTLTLSQWLQFVFIPRLSAIVEQVQPLPQSCQITPMVEEYFGGLGINSEALVAHINQLDTLLSLET